MADNDTLPATGSVVRSKDRAGVKTQVVTFDLNPAGAELLLAGFLPVANVTRQVQEATAVLAAAAVFNGAALDAGNNAVAASGFSKVRVAAFADQPGTVNVQQSRDNITWRTTSSQAVLAGVAVTVEAIVVRRYVRVSYTNGATVQTVFELDTCLVAV